MSLLQPDTKPDTELFLAEAMANASAGMLKSRYVAIDAPMGGGKTSLLAQKIFWLQDNSPHEPILVICSNGYRKNCLSQRVKKLVEAKLGDSETIPIAGTPQLMIATYAGLVRQTLLLFWPLVEKELLRHLPYQNGITVTPQLTGFEATEMILRYLIDHAPLQQQLPGIKLNKKSIGRQLIRRLRLRAENALSRQEMAQRALTANEVGSDAVSDIILQSDKLAYQHRILDSGKQLEVFHKLLQSEPQIQQYITKISRHLLVDDLDESNPSLQQLILHALKSKDKPETVWLAADTSGGTRRGYLNACPEGWQDLLAAAQFERFKLLPPSPPVAAKLLVANTLCENWTRSKPVTISDTDNIIQHQPFAGNTLEMLDNLVQDVANEINAGRYKASDFVLISPNRELFLDYLLDKNFKRRDIALQSIRGNKRSVDHPACRYLITLLQLLFAKHWHVLPSPTHFRALLRDVLRLSVIDPTGCEAVVFEYRAQLLLNATALETIDNWQALAAHFSNAEAHDRFLLFAHALFAFLPDTDITQQTIENSLYQLFDTFIAPYLNQKPLSLLDLTPVKQLLGTLPLFSLATTFYPDNAEKAGQIWLSQLLYGAVSDTPSQPDAIKNNAVILCTPQKLIDLEIKRPIQCWLDIRSAEWCRSDSAPLYNAWVYSPHWTKNPESIALHDEHLAQTRAAHITRSMMLLAQEKVWVYEAESDVKGYEQVSKFPDCLRTENNLHKNSEANNLHQAEKLLAGLRTDQAEIKNYQSGPMALLAPPGAGKTHTMLGLVLSLVQNGNDPEKIILLTYMDSAARTFKRRLQATLPANSKQPLVCTIHSLAYRILTESDRKQYVGLDDIKIIDELDQQILLQNIVENAESNRSDNHLENISVRDAIRGIQFFKAHHITPWMLANKLKGITQGFRRIKQLLPIYTEYEILLTQKGLLDYTDLITKAIELLDKDPYLLQDFQKQWQFIIEDEAQDSSVLLQALIQKLAGERHNIIRSGDPNQAITGTFSHADTEQFRQFVTDCQAKHTAIQLAQSSRCAIPIQQLANEFIKACTILPAFKNAFLPIWLKPVEGKNPELKEPITLHVFENSQAEVEAIVRKISTLYQSSNDVIAVLCRTNKQVTEWITLLRNHQIPAFSYGNIPQLDAVFMSIVYTFELLRNPMSQMTTANWLLALADAGWIETGTLTTELLPENLIEALDASKLEAMPDLQLAQDLFMHLINEEHDLTMLLVTLADVVFGTPDAKLKALLTATAIQGWLTESEEQMAPVSGLDMVCDQLTTCLLRNRYPFKLPESDDTAVPDQQSHSKASVVVMTLHKSKGQEFDTVIMPALSESDFPSAPESVSLDNSERLEAEVRYLNQILLTPQATQADYSLEIYKQHTQDLMREKIEEEARLIYVGMTRAKSRLIMTSAESTRGKNNKARQQKVSGFIGILQTCLSPVPMETV